MTSNLNSPQLKTTTITLQLKGEIISHFRYLRTMLEMGSWYAGREQDINGINKVLKDLED